MKKFEVIAGSHTTGTGKDQKTYKAGQIVESHKNLEQIFVNKFKRRHDLEKGSASTPTIKQSAKVVPQDLKRDPDDDKEDDVDSSPAPANPAPARNDSEAEADTQGDDVSKDFAKEIGEENVIVIRNDDGEYLILDGDSRKLLSKGEELTTKAAVRSFIKKYLK